MQPNGAYQPAPGAYAYGAPPAAAAPGPYAAPAPGAPPAGAAPGYPGAPSPRGAPGAPPPGGPFAYGAPAGGGRPGGAPAHHAPAPLSHHHHGAAPAAPHLLHMPGPGPQRAGPGPRQPQGVPSPTSAQAAPGGAAWPAPPPRPVPPRHHPQLYGQAPPAPQYGQGPPAPQYGGGGYVTVQSQAAAAAAPTTRPLPGGRAGASANGEPRFRCRTDGADGLVQVGLEGMCLYNSGGDRCIRAYPLESIARWAVQGATRFVFWVKQEGSAGQAEVCLEAKADTVQEILDTLMAACMQMKEMIDNPAALGLQEPKKEEPKTAAAAAAEPTRGRASSLGGLFGRGGGDQGIKVSGIVVPSTVEYWRRPEYDGWLQSEGETTKSWRKRWFVLKGGYLLRFLNDAVTAAVKPRGGYDLRKCWGVTIPAGVETGLFKGKVVGAPLKLEFLEDPVVLVCDTTSERDIWKEVLERAIKDIKTGGKKKEAAAGGASQGSGASVPPSMLQQLKSGYSDHSKKVAPSTVGVTVVGYDGGGSGHYPSAPPPSSGASHAADWQVCYTPEGQVYYHDPATGRTQWQAP